MLVSSCFLVQLKHRGDGRMVRGLSGFRAMTRLASEVSSLSGIAKKKAAWMVDFGVGNSSPVNQ